MKKLFSTAYSQTSFSFAMLMMRIILGGLMIPHGFNKLANFARDAQQFEDPFHLGHTPSLVLAIFAEFLCSILVILGLFTRLACIPLIITMGVVVFYVHNAAVFGKAQTATLFLCGFIVLLFTGPGKWSLDKMIGR